MERFQGVLGIIAILGLMVLISKYRRKINWRIIGSALALQALMGFLVIKWEPGAAALEWFAGKVTDVIHFADAGTEFVFGPLMAEDFPFMFAVRVLPVQEK